MWNCFWHDSSYIYLCTVAIYCETSCFCPLQQVTKHLQYKISLTEKLGSFTIAIGKRHEISLEGCGTSATKDMLLLKKPDHVLVPPSLKSVVKLFQSSKTTWTGKQEAAWGQKRLTGNGFCCCPGAQRCSDRLETCQPLSPIKTKKLMLFKFLNEWA